MGQNQFAESLVEIMLSWMRWLTSWFWNIVNSEGISGGGFLQWFAGNWVSLAVFLIIAGAVIDWIVWMIRWRPHWLWLRKRQIIYEEVPVKKHPVEKKNEPVHRKKVDLRKAPAMPSAEQDEHRRDTEHDAEEDEYFDPFAEENDHRTEADDFSDWDSTDDPYSSEE